MLTPAKTALIALSLATPGAAFAASNNASDPFASEVEQKCTDVAGGDFRRPQVVVDPSGTQSYGVAIIMGRSKELRGRAAVICVVDRKTGKVELGSPLSPDVVRVRGPKKDNGGEDTGKHNKRNKMQNDNTGAGGQDDDEDDSDGGQ
jgi:hypothetical protein